MKPENLKEMVDRGWSIEVHRLGGFWVCGKENELGVLEVLGSGETPDEAIVSALDSIGRPVGEA